MSAGEVLEEELCCLKAVCRIVPRGHTGEEENEEEESDLLVAAALSKVDAGVDFGRAGGWRSASVFLLGKGVTPHGRCAQQKAPELL